MPAKVLDNSSMIDLDRNATTNVDLRVCEAMFELVRSGRLGGNPSSVHRLGQQARGIVEQARLCVARSLGAVAQEVLFTSGGTESNNLAILGAVRARQAKGERFGLLTSPIEHPSITQVAKHLANNGTPISWLRLATDGQISVDSVLAALESAPEVGVISLALANHELGDLYAIADIARAVRELRPETWIHCDAVQAYGKVPLSFPDLGVDMMSISAHKAYGPVGVGALLLRRTIDLRPILHGGQQERGLRPGTESPLLLHGFARASELVITERPLWHEHGLKLRQRLLSGLESIEGIHIYGDPMQHIGNTLLISVDQCPAQLLLINLDLEGFAVSAGAACSSGNLTGSSVLTSLGLPASVATSALRISVCKDNSMDEIERFLTVLIRTIGRMRTVYSSPTSVVSSEVSVLAPTLCSKSNQNSGVRP